MNKTAKVKRRVINIQYQKTNIAVKVIKVFKQQKWNIFREAEEGRAREQSE